MAGLKPLDKNSAFAALKHLGEGPRPESIPQALKRESFGTAYGTSELVPFPLLLHRLLAAVKTFFTAALKRDPILNGIMARINSCPSVLVHSNLYASDCFIRSDSLLRPPVTSGPMCTR